MRKFLTILSGLILALLIIVGVFWIQGKNVMDMFNEKDKPTPTLPTETTPVVQKEVNLSYDQLMSKADEDFKDGFFTLAATEYSKAALLAPDQLEPYLKLVDTHLELRNYDKALANIQNILKKDSNNLEAKFDEIKVKIKLSDFNSAKTLIDSYPAGSAQSSEVLYYKGALIALFNNHELAKATLKEALQSNPSAVLSEKINRILQAYEAFDATQAGEELYLKILLAKSFNQNEDYEIAIHILKETLKTRGDLRDGWILLGFSYLNLGNYQFALTAFDKAYSLDPTWTTTLYFLGITNKELGNTQKAINDFNAALLGGFDQKVIIQNYLADLYFQIKDYTKATAAYEAVLQVNKQDVNAFVRPIWLYLDYLNQPESALKLAQTAVTTFPDSAMSYNLLGWSYIGMGDYKNADANLNKALALDPKLAAAYQNLGLMNEKWGKIQLALQNYQKAYELDKNGSIGNLAAKEYNELLKKSLSEE